MFCGFNKVWAIVVYITRRPDLKSWFELEAWLEGLFTHQEEVRESLVCPNQLASWYLPNHGTKNAVTGPYRQLLLSISMVQQIKIPLATALRVDRFVCMPKLLRLIWGDSTHTQSGTNHLEPACRSARRAWSWSRIAIAVRRGAFQLGSGRICSNNAFSLKLAGTNVYLLQKMLYPGKLELFTFEHFSFFSIYFRWRNTWN